MGIPRLPSPACSPVTNLSLCSHRGGPSGRRAHKLTGKAPVAESSLQPQPMDRPDPHPALTAVQALRGWVCTCAGRGSLRSVKLPVCSQPTTEAVVQTLLCVFKLKRWEHQTPLPAFCKICMQVKKQQLELDMEQQTGSK